MNISIGTMTIVVAAFVAQACSGSSFEGAPDREGIDNAGIEARSRNPTVNHKGIDAPEEGAATNHFVDSLDQPGFLSKTGLGAHHDYNTSTPSAPGTNDGYSRIEEGADAVLWLPCGADPQARYPFSGPPGMTLRVGGDFCAEPKRGGSLAIVFVIDFSTSMVDLERNDPTVNGSCGRLAAVRSIVDELIKINGPQAPISVTVVGFGSDADVRLPPTPIGSVSPALAVGSLCGSNGGIAMTNYQAAFQVTDAVLGSIEGDAKQVYFITDGEPTKARGGSPREAGLQAAQMMRFAHPEAAINAVFLGSGGQGGVDLLAAIAGDASRVRAVANAGEMAEKIREFTLPALVSPRVAATVDSVVGSSGLPILSFKQTAEDRYTFATAPLVMTGQQGVATEYVIRIMVPVAGGAYTSGAIVEFTIVP